jgi:creatinine amidohydrolase
MQKTTKIFLFGIMIGMILILNVPDVLSSTEEGYSIFHDTMVDMTWQEVEKAAKEGAIILLPTAVIEEHGPHMGCGVDTYLAYQTCKLARRELESRGIKTLIAPPFYWGINRTTHVFPGTFTVRPETMKALLEDILRSLKSWGFKHVYNINWHYDGGHISTLFQTIKNAQESVGIKTYFVLSEEDVRRFGLEGNEPFIVVHKSPPVEAGPQEYLDLHAGAGETGIMAAHFPDQVDMELTRTLKPTQLTYRDVGKWVTDARDVTPLGYFGDPASSKIDESKKYHEAFCKMIAEAIAIEIKTNNKKGETK